MISIKTSKLLQQARTNNMSFILPEFGAPRAKLHSAPHFALIQVPIISAGVVCNIFNNSLYHAILQFLH